MTRFILLSTQSYEERSLLESIFPQKLISEGSVEHP